MIFGPYKHQALTVPTPILLCSHSHSDPYSNPVPIPVGIPCSDRIKHNTKYDNSVIVMT